MSRYALGQRSGDARPRIVHIISDAGPHPYFRTLIEAGGLRRDGLAVGCVGPAGPLQEEMKALGVATFAAGARGRRAFPVATLRLAQYLRSMDAEIVQTHLVDGSLVGLSAARLARTPVAVFTAHHSHELPYHGWRLSVPDRLISGRLSDHIIAPSHNVADTLAEWAHVSPDKIEVVPHGFDFTVLDPLRFDREEIRRRLSFDGKLVFGSVGRIYKLKNYSGLLSAFGSVLGDVPDAILAIAGPGDPEPLRAQASALGLQDRVVFLGPTADVPELLAAFDVFVHPAIAESFGMVIVEAMAMELPIVCTPVGIAPELIDSGNAGVLCAGSDAHHLESGLTEMIALRSEWPQLGRAARARVIQMTARKMAVQYESLYTQWATDASRRAVRS